MAYTADHVGTWTLNVTSASGAQGSLSIVVGHGERPPGIGASTEHPADDVVYLNTTRIDVRGNRLLQVLPQSNWTRIADGSS